MGFRNITDALNHLVNSIIKVFLTQFTFLDEGAYLNQSRNQVTKGEFWISLEQGKRDPISTTTKQTHDSTIGLPKFK